ncbi:MAG: AAA family ATPase [Bacteroidales bacterium]|nr:AAA family ATPase [Bacteroidales bacterium]
MQSRADFLYSEFRRRLDVDATECQDRFLRTAADFLMGDDHDIMVVNGYAGTGKTTAVSAVVAALEDLKLHTVLLAPTGRAAKVLGETCGRPAYTIHKHIYRQRSVGEDGFGQFSIVPNKARNTLFVVDEVSLLGIEEGTRQSSAAFGTGNLLADLIGFVRAGTDCRLLLIGDAAQLPPIGLEASPALAPDFMDSFGGVCYETLTTVVRQARESGILHNATLLRELISAASPDDGFDDLRLQIQGFDDICRIGGSELIEAIGDAYGKYGEDSVVVVCRSNKRAIRYNMGIRSQVQFREERLVRGDKLMIVKNCYQFVEDVEGMQYIANGDIATLERIGRFEDRYGLHFADATLTFPDYDNATLDAKVCLDTLESESASLTYEQQNQLYQGVSEDYSNIKGRKARYDAVREDPFYNALQLKYANAITAHKSQGGQWDCVFVDCPFWQEEQTLDDLKWLYTALTRAVKKVYLVNFPSRFFE